MAELRRIDRFVDKFKLSFNIYAAVINVYYIFLILFCNFVVYATQPLKVLSTFPCDADTSYVLVLLEDSSV